MERNMKLLTGKASIEKAIKSIQGRGKRLDRDIQQAALSVINHIQQHGDVTVANTLIEAMPKGSRVNALKAYLETFGKVTWDAKEGMVYAKNKKTDMNGASAIMWTEFKPEPEYRPLDLAQAVQQLFDRIQRDKEKGGTHDDKHVNAIKTLLSELNPEFEPDF
jgi:hypothetical protein